MSIQRLLDVLHPLVRDAASKALGDLHSHDLNVYAFETLRSHERQKEMFETGKSKAKPGCGLHEYGLALDLAFKDALGWSWNGDWESVGRIMTSHGFEWAKYFKSFPELCHFQMMFGLTLDELKKAKSEGKLSEVIYLANERHKK